MTTRWRSDQPRDTDQILADFLADEAPPSEPPLLLPAVLARTALTRRRPAWRIPSRWPPLNVAWRPRPHGRTSTMATPIKFVAAAVAISVLAVVVGIVPRTTGPGGNDLATSPSPSAGSSPIALPTIGPGQPEGATVDLESGTAYFLDDVWDDGSADLILTVPAAGWGHSTEGHISKDLNPDGWFQILITPWWRARNLAVDPCHWQNEGELDPPVGPTVDDLATALVAQAAGNASTPTDVTVGGYRGKRVELSAPAGLDIATCDGGEFVRWWDASACCYGPYMYPEADGRNIVYILDVGGTRAVIDILHKPDATEADLAEAEQIVASMRFRPLPTGPSPAAS